jgi:hypothetical protein
VTTRPGEITPNVVMLELGTPVRGFESSIKAPRIRGS